jgi:hypothetical protein
MFRVFLWNPTVSPPVTVSSDAGSSAIANTPLEKWKLEFLDEMS